MLFHNSGILLPRWSNPEIFEKVFCSADRRIDISYVTRNRTSRFFDIKYVALIIRLKL